MKEFNLKMTKKFQWVFKSIQERTENQMKQPERKSKWNRKL